MLLLLFFVLLAIIARAYNKLQSLLAPAILFNVGLLFATLMALVYEEEWQLSKIHNETFFCVCIGGGLFSIINVLISKKKGNDVLMSDTSGFNFSSLFHIRHLKILLSFSLLLEVYILYAKYTAMVGYYGVSDLSILLYSVRIDGVGGESVVLFSSFFSNIAYLCSCLFFFWCTILSIYILKGGKDKIIVILLILNMVMHFFMDMMGGDRGTSINSIFCFGVIFMLKYMKISGSFKIPWKYLKYAGIGALAIVISLKASALLMGREHLDEDTSVLYEFAVYCGAEIKNLDIWFDAPKHSDWFGQSTLGTLISELNSKFDTGIVQSKFSINHMFNTVGIFNLGNVLTTFYNFYLDGGYWGISVFTILMAIIASTVYNRVHRCPNPIHTYVSEILYAKIAFSVFMCFFANRFYNEIISIMFLRYLLYSWLLGFVFKKYIYIK